MWFCFIWIIYNICYSKRKVTKTLKKAHWNDFRLNLDSFSDIHLMQTQKKHGLYLSFDISKKKKEKKRMHWCWESRRAFFSSSICRTKFSKCSSFMFVFLKRLAKFIANSKHLRLSSERWKWEKLLNKKKRKKFVKS